MSEAPSGTECPALSRRARLRFDKVRGSHVLMLPETAVMLSDTSAEILALCDGHRSVREIIEALQERYPGAELEGDVREFLEAAKTQRWLA